MSEKGNGHPEFVPEREHLKRISQSMYHEVNQLRTGMPAASDRGTQRALVPMFRAQAAQLDSARSEPYFARIDFHSTFESEGPAFYLGKIAFRAEGAQIISWAAPIAKLYYRSRPGHASYLAPSGPVDGDLVLKRLFDIQIGALVSINDAFDIRDGASGAASGPSIEDEAHTVEDDYLARTLTSRRGGPLEDITATIREEQYDLITAPPEGVLLIQGVAGSGKTSLALQRLAYLLYPENANALDENECIVFGPNSTFVDHIKDILPGLGVPNIRQVALSAWSLDELGHGGATLTDRAFEQILSPKTTDEDRAALKRAVRLRNSVEMLVALAGFHDYLRDAITPPGEGLVLGSFGPATVDVRLSATVLHQSIVESRRDHLNQHRAEARRRVAALAVTAYTEAFKSLAARIVALRKRLEVRSSELRKSAAALPHSDADADSDLNEAAAFLLEPPPAPMRTAAESMAAAAREYDELAGRLQLRLHRMQEDHSDTDKLPALRAALRAAALRAFDAWWPTYDAVVEYRRLLSDPDLLKRLSADAFGESEVSAITSASLSEPSTIDLSDLAPMHYLGQLLNGTEPRFSHVVIDEAQDASPVYFEILRRLSRTGSFTIVGDINQGLTAFRGVEDWNALASWFGGVPVKRHDITRSYRSTAEITEFGNRLLGGLPGPISLAQPFSRHGPAPEMLRSSSFNQQESRLRETLERLHREGVEDIAVLCRDAGEVKRVVRALRNGRLSRTPQVLRIDEAKGLEFEGVVVVDDGQHAPGNSPEELKLLYVAASRALHRLILLSVGSASAIEAKVMGNP